MSDEAMTLGVRGAQQDGCTSSHFQPRPVRYGLPCASCKAYYPSALTFCPVCRCNDRVSPTAAPGPGCGASLELFAMTSGVGGEQHNGCTSSHFQPRPVRYGLPCASCRAYYPSALTFCPVCRCNDRVSPTADLGSKLDSIAALSGTNSDSELAIVALSSGFRIAPQDDDYGNGNGDGVGH